MMFQSKYVQAVTADKSFLARPTLGDENLLLDPHFKEGKKRKVASWSLADLI